MINSRGNMHWRREDLLQLEKLKMISTCSIGADSFDLDAIRERNIALCNIPGKTAAIVAEHALALILGAAKRLCYQTSELRAGRWRRCDNLLLSNATLGVVGTGAIGNQVVRLAKAIGMRVIAWTFNPDAARAAELGVEYVELDQLLRQSDVVSLHIMLTDESRGFIGRDQLEQMKPGAILVNTARGPIVDTQALVHYLQSGRLGGAAVDVYDEEPLGEGHPLLECEQVVLTPHSADHTPEGVDALNQGAVDNVLAFLDGQPQNVIS
jgi:D-3-phosphoglycerate dehydrogenase